MKNEADVFDVISTEEPNEANLRSLRGARPQGLMRSVACAR